MFQYATPGTDDLQRSQRFYDATLGALKLARICPEGFALSCKHEKYS